MACGSNKLGHNAGCFVEGLTTLGYVEGRNVAFEYRFAEEAPERLPTLAAELVSLRPDVIFTFTTAYSF
jgi:putative ABC transport system substrate-binding protein